MSGFGRMNALLPGGNRALDAKVQSSLQMVDYFIRRNYLSQLCDCPVQELSSVQAKANIRLFRVDRIIYDENEEVNEKLTSVYSALHHQNATVFLLVVGKKIGVEFYLGTRSQDAIGISADVLSQSFTAHFPGSKLALVENDDDKVGRILRGQNFDNISSVTVVPSLREDNEKKFVQGLEKIIDAMQGKTYSAIFISSPVSKSDLDARRLGLEQLYSAISPYAKTTIAYGENQSDAVSEGVFENFTSSINESISNTIGTSTTVSEGHSHGSSIAGYTSSKGTSYSQGQSSSDTTTRGTSEARGSGTNSNKTHTSGKSQTLTKEITNKTVENILAYIDEQFERIKEFEAFGAWESAAYFCAGKIEDSLVAANAFKAVVSGEKSNSEYAYINTWSRNRNDGHIQAVSKYLECCCHPRFQIRGDGVVKEQVVTAGNFISGKELPVFMSMPQKSVSGVTVTMMAEFSRNVSHRIDSDVAPGRRIALGQIHHMGQNEPFNEVLLDLDSLTSHCFICGSTGSGKSNTTYYLIQQFIRKKVPFLVVEPAKGEYKAQFGGLDGIHIFNTNPFMGAMLKVNPFEFHPSIHILEHLDRLVEIFNACWEMYAAMPAILKSAIEQAYIKKGWDLQNSIYVMEGVPKFPTFADVLETLPQIIKNSSYSADTKGDYTGALVTRVESLTNGITGQIFCDNYFIPDPVLFDENTIVDLSRIGSTETKALIMGILVMRLNEYRMANATGSNKELMHVTILEEAHHLLKNVSHEQGQQSANPVGKSVEMICQSIAEMRTYGEGFIIVDQSPSSVDIAAIKNTNTKIAMRLPEKSDCEAIGNSLGLNESQVKELAKLPVGVAVVLQNNWLESVLCKINLADDRYAGVVKINSFQQMKQLRSVVLEAMLHYYKAHENIDPALILPIIDAVDISTSAKEEMKGRVEALATASCRCKDNPHFYSSLIYISGLKGVFAANEPYILGREKDTAVALNWHAKLMAQLKGSQGIVSFAKDITYDMLLRRCIHAMQWQASKVNYRQLYSTLYGE